MITNFKIYEEYSSDFKKYILFKFDSNVSILFEVSHKWGNNHRIKALYRNDDKGFRKSKIQKKYNSFTTSLLKKNIIAEFDNLQDAIDYFKIYIQSKKYNI